MINRLPIVILHNIYKYGGSNVFYINKELLIYINKLRERFYKNPIKFYYRTIEWKYRSTVSQHIINITDKRMRRSLRLNKNIENIDVSNNIVGVLSDKKFIKVNKNFKKRLIPNEFLEDNKNFYRINNGFTLDIFDMWSNDERLSFYMGLWV